MTPSRLLLLALLLLAAHPGGTWARCPGGGCVEEAAGGQPEKECAEAGGCRRREGQLCGVYTPNCAPGLQCHPSEEEQAPLQALLQGRGRCIRARVPSGESAPRPCHAYPNPESLPWVPEQPHGLCHGPTLLALCTCGALLESGVQP